MCTVGSLALTIPFIYVCGITCYYNPAIVEPKNVNFYFQTNVEVTDHAICRVFDMVDNLTEQR